MLLRQISAYRKTRAVLLEYLVRLEFVKDKLRLEIRLHKFRFTQFQIQLSDLDA